MRLVLDGMQGAMPRLASAPRNQSALHQAVLDEPATGEASRGDERLDREALVLDLWVRASDSGRSNFVTLGDRPLPAVSGWQGWLNVAGDGGVFALEGDAASVKNGGRASYGESVPQPGEYVDENGNGQWDPGEEQIVTVTGRREVDDHGWEPNPGNNTGGGESQGGGGSGGDSGQPKKVADHEQDCGTDDGAAVQIAKKVMGTPPGAGPPNPLTTPSGNSWTGVEFGAVIARTPDGRYGALNDAIYSNDWFGQVNLPIPIGDSNVVGIWHTHTPRGDSYQQNIDRYPSSSPDGNGLSDWQQLQRIGDIVAPNDPTYDPSIWITGADGVTREFKLSERDYYESLTPEQMQDGEGLEGKERTQSCG